MLADEAIVLDTLVAEAGVGAFSHGVDHETVLGTHEVVGFARVVETLVLGLAKCLIRFERILETNAGCSRFPAVNEFHRNGFGRVTAAVADCENISAGELTVILDGFLQARSYPGRERGAIDVADIFHGLGTQGHL